MRVTLDIPDELIQEARRLLGLKSTRGIVIASLRELIHGRRFDELKDMLGKVELDIDIPASRRRPKSHGR